MSTQIACGAHGGFLCRLCGRRFTHRRNIRRHFEHAHAQTEFVFACPAPQCGGRRFDKRSAFSNHLYTKHLEYRGFRPMEFAIKIGEGGGEPAEEKQEQESVYHDDPAPV